MSKEYYRKRIIDLRADLAKEKEAKKKDNAYYADMVKRASTPSSKASYRKSKIDHAASHDRRMSLSNIKLRAQKHRSNGKEVNEHTTFQTRVVARL